MTESSTPKIVRWPFLAADLLLLGLAGYLVRQGTSPLDLATMGFVVFCVVAAAWLGVSPWTLEYRGVTKLSESDRLATAVEQIARLEEVGQRISAASSQWLGVQERADKTASTAKELAEGMSREAQQFRTFLERANENEKAHLRLEVEKLRRAEGDWLEVLIRILDNVFALHGAAVRSEQPKLIEQIGAFQHVCRETCRRIGLVPFAAVREQQFDPAMHQLADPSEQAGDTSSIRETLAAGYTFQGQLVRRAVVQLEKRGEPPVPAESSVKEASVAQSEPSPESLKTASEPAVGSKTEPPPPGQTTLF